LKRHVNSTEAKSLLCRYFADHKYALSPLIFAVATALLFPASPASAVVAAAIAPDHERQASMCRYIAMHPVFDNSQALAHDVRLVSEIFANDSNATAASADGWLAGRIGMLSLKDASAEKRQLEACMAELVDLLASYLLSSCGFETSNLRQVWSEEEQREVDEVLERYGQYALGDWEGPLDYLLAAAKN
jgi:uncharacterized membrane protein